MPLFYLYGDLNILQNPEGCSGLSDNYSIRPPPVSVVASCSRAPPAVRVNLETGRISISLILILIIATSLCMYTYTTAPFISASSYCYPAYINIQSTAKSHQLVNGPWSINLAYSLIQLAETSCNPSPVNFDISPYTQYNERQTVFI